MDERNTETKINGRFAPQPDFIKTPVTDKFIKRALSEDDVRLVQLAVGHGWGGGGSRLLSQVQVH